MPNLPKPLFSEAECVLILSIKKEHLDRIISGLKTFELRKSLPRRPFGKVFFYQTEGGGIVGSSEVESIIEATPQKLWDIVGERATTRDRFFTYFQNKRVAFAIELKNPIKFSAPIWPSALREYLPKFTAPQSYLILDQSHPLSVALSTTASDPGTPAVKLRPIKPVEYSQFEDITTKEIGSKYAEINHDFAESLINTHTLGFDPNGFLTIGKEVLGIEDSQGTLLGFTVLTYKRGRSVKSGPTILFEEHRHNGLGPHIRKALEDRVMAHGASKIYCTCPAIASPILSLLLKCGYKVEGHLRHQYSDESDELILSKELREIPIPINMQKRSISTPGRVLPNLPIKVSKKSGKDLAELLQYAGLQLPTSIAERVITNSNASVRTNSSYSSKPRSILWLQSNVSRIGACVLSFKRGGSARGILAVSTSHTPSISKLITSAVNHCIQMQRKKIYFIHPLTDSLVIHQLKNHGFVVEAALNSPYQAGQDSVILSKWI